MRWRSFTVGLALLWLMLLNYGPATTPRLVVPGSTTLAEAVRVAVIGDYGTNSQGEADVAALVHSWEPDAIITVGDNNYPDGAASTIETNIGQYYWDYIAPYSGTYGVNTGPNRFFPALGNHDWVTANAQPYLDYFTLPGNERYYTTTLGPITFFAIDSDTNEPDGVGQSSVQALWLQNALAAATTPWKVVYMHHPPYSSGQHGSTVYMQWPYATWGADIVLAGHDHTYERLRVNWFPYIVVGTGGASLYDFGTPLPESVRRYNTNYGALLITATPHAISYHFINRNGVLIDTLNQTAPVSQLYLPLTQKPNRWRLYLPLLKR